MLSDEALLRATAANHRAWFMRVAHAAGGRVERFGGIDLVVAGRGGTVPFPRSRAPLDDVVRRARRLRLGEVGCWSLGEDPAFGTLLVARGFQWGWQPHWMALELARLADDEPGYEVVRAEGPCPDDLPYASPLPDPARVPHLAVRRDGRTVGHVAVNPWRGVAGIYAMGVLPGERRKGIGRALTVAACRLGRELGCAHAVLNATGDGERVYRGVGFRSLGLGRTWWLFRGPPPTRRQTRLAEAIGFGDLDALKSLRPRSAELEAPLPGGATPLALTVVTGQVEVAAWLLERRPDLVSRPLESRGGTLLHVAVEWDNLDLVCLALALGADRDARDRWWQATPLEWAEHLGRPGLAALLG